MYGPTETTIWSTTARVSKPGEPLTIGRPIANTTLYVLDAALQPVPVGRRRASCTSAATGSRAATAAGPT